MEANRKRILRSGAEYDHLFPKAAVDTHTIMRHAGVSDTVSFIPKVVGKTLDQTRKIAQKLKGYTPYETCCNIWDFVYRHIAYRKDKDGYEQIRSPARSWHDRRSGVDCDCYATFISSILTNLGIRHKLRITKYNHNYFQHIYPIAVLRNGKEVILDCVTERFDYEVPYSEKKDYQMDLQYLNGIDLDLAHDIHGLDGDDLGRHNKHGHKHKEKHHHHKRNRHTHESFEDFMDHPDQVPPFGVKKKKGFKKVMSFVNKLNPATLTLRNGVLASMKLDIGAAAKRLRWTYLTPNEAKRKGMDMQKWKHLVQVRQKLDNIFYGAGGKPENLKKSIMKGKGNKDKSVHGFDALPHHHDVHHLNRHMPLHKVLGHELFFDENEGIHGVGELGELGEPLTMASITAASGVIAAIVKMIKKVGDVFGGKGEHAADFDPSANADAEKDVPGADKVTEDKSGADDKSPSGDSGGGSSSSDESDSGGPSGSSNKGSSNNPSGNSSDNNSDDMNTSKTASKAMTVAKTDGSDTSVDKVADSTPAGSGSGGADNEGFWQKHKKWLLPASIGVGGIAVIAIGMHMMHGSKGKPMHGIPHRRKNHQRKAKPKTTSKAKHHSHHSVKRKTKKKKSVALL